MKRLSVKQQKFADEYIKTGNSYQSALKAGYSETIAKGQSYKFIENLGIQEYIHAKTDKIIKKEADETDAVLRNIYRIASGKRIRRRFTKIDNLQKEITLKGVTNPTAEMRKEYEKDEVTSTPAPVKEQVAAAEIWLKYRGMLSSDSKPIENAKIRKAEAETKIAEAKLKLLSSDNDGQMTALTNLMNILQGGGDKNNADK